MGKATYIGTVVAGCNQEEAIASFLKTLNSNEDNQKTLFSLSSASDKVFLTSTENLVKPMSPFTGRSETKLVTEDMRTISSSLQLPSTNEIVAKDNFKLISSVCQDCDSVLVSDSKNLLQHCIVCGAEQDQEIEDSEKIDLSIVDDNYEIDDINESNSEDDEEYDVNEEIEAMLDEDEEDLDDEDELDDEEIEAMLAEAEEDEEELDEEDDEDLDDEEIEAMLSGEDEDDDLDETIQQMLSSDEDCDDEDLISAADDLLEGLEAEEVDEEDDEVDNYDEEEIEAMLAEAEYEDMENFDEEESDEDLNEEDEDLISAADDLLEGLEAEEVDEEDDESDNYDEEEIEAMLAEAEYEDMENFNEEDEDLDDEEEIEAMLAEAEEDLENDEDLEYQELEAMLSEDDDYEDEDEGELIDEEEIEAMLAENDDEGELIDEEEIKDMLSEDDDLLSSEEIDLDDVEFDSDDVEFTEDEELVSGKISCEDIDIDDQMQVDLVNDNIDESMSFDKSKVNLVYVPSENIDGHRWYALVNDAPVAIATVFSVGPEKSEIFASDAFRKATETLMTRHGVASGLRDMGFNPLKIVLPIKNIVESNVNKAKREIIASNQNKVETFREDVKAALATAAVGINKSFFSKSYNPIKAELYDILSNAGVRNAEIIIDEAFASKADEYHKLLLDQAFDLMQKPVEARNEISKAVMTASYQRASSADDSSLSSSVSKQLGSIGNSSVSVSSANVPTPVSQNEINPSFNQRAASVIKGLVR